MSPATLLAARTSGWDTEAPPEYPRRSPEWYWQRAVASFEARHGRLPHPSRDR